MFLHLVVIHSKTNRFERGGKNLDVAKRAGRVGFESGQSSLQVNRVASQNGSFLNGLIRSRDGLS